MRKILSILCLLSFAFSLSAQEGKTGFDYLLLPASTRISALGGVNVSIIENDLSTVYHNPAFLGQEMDKTIDANYLNYIADVGVGSVSFAKAIGERSAWGIGVNYANYGKMYETTQDQQVLGSLKASDICGNIFFSRDLSEKLRGGVDAKFIYSDYAHNTAIGLGVDLGLSYYDRDRNLSVGLVSRNMGRQIKAYEDELANLPWDVQLGFSKKIAHAPIRYSLTMHDINRLTAYSFVRHFVVSLEFLPTENFWIGAAYNLKRASDMQIADGNKFAGFSFGAGLRVKAFAFGFSVAQYHPSATAFMFGVSTSLAEMKL
ncbi:MAG: type IX secretion system protein PorQ [Dysgonamonadaceae bacterium]|jgi:hypothetical protein|nr:type IX secretion system protein PorQ [Dysgonamonadaceae bacterium]